MRFNNITRLSDRKGEAGISLLATAALIFTLGMFFTAGFRLYSIYESYKTSAVTSERMAYIQKALEHYVSFNGRYPCPAPLTAEIDSEAYGMEAAADCTLPAANVPGTFRPEGTGGRIVRVGAVPVRALNLPDIYMNDGYRHRFIYAVTEEYTKVGSAMGTDNGAISIIDDNGNSATANEGNIVQLVYSMGPDTNGAYTVGGSLESDCNTAIRSGENCNFNMDATFLNTVTKSTYGNETFAGKIAYSLPQTVVACDKKSNKGVPKEVAYLVDTSMSMQEASPCPAGSLKNCKRIDVAHWAMRRAMPARIYGNKDIEDPGTTRMTGFVTKTGRENDNTYKKIDNGIKDSTAMFDDPTKGGYEAPTDEEMYNDLDNRMKNMCAVSYTPLGVHIQVLADRIGNGTSDRPNKIVVLSDGISNVGINPLDVARKIAEEMPYLQVDIIDVAGNPALMEIAQITGGKYYSTTNPTELLNALFSSVGVCKSDAPPSAPTDKKLCGNSGGG